MAKKAYEKVKDIEAKVVEEVEKPKPPPEKPVPPPPDLKTPPPPFVPPPEVVIQAPPPPTPPLAVQSNTPPPRSDVHAAPAPTPAAPPAPPAKPAKITAGMVCTKMGKPESPSVSWSGTAEFLATATVKAGRVVDVQINVIRKADDRKAQRAMIQSITQALQDTYECPGDHVFEQPFVFKID
ncbi:hypothetical protein RQP53_07925 [Paucibacter sp. APW11]|uniref:Ig-like domain-containing protein n=1 Tax=Roseateles aquae TaxID=3077235 RepID=A0ABU3P9J0_9BURK|nr:hypothetical protein [Paucibacter sp. APW11]MDT8999193.1 hypothetical protein [Paucibacter sp. APW11]